MRDYRIYLHDGPDSPHIAEIITANDDAEAVVLGEMRLLLTSTYTHAFVTLEGELVGSLKRDSEPGLDELAAGADGSS